MDLEYDQASTKNIEMKEILVRGVSYHINQLNML